jgi:hypothetical protein
VFVGFSASNDVAVLAQNMGDEWMLLDLDPEARIELRRKFELEFNLL